jgi:hypothetical protein
MGTKKNPFTPRALSRAAARMGRKGGGTPTTKPKGFAALSPERILEIRRMGIAALAAKRGRK